MPQALELVRHAVEAKTDSEAWKWALAPEICLGLLILYVLWAACCVLRGRPFMGESFWSRLPGVPEAADPSMSSRKARPLLLWLLGTGAVLTSVLVGLAIATRPTGRSLRDAKGGLELLDSGPKAPVIELGDAARRDLLEKVFAVMEKYPAERGRSCALLDQAWPLDGDHLELLLAHAPSGARLLAEAAQEDAACLRALHALYFVYAPGAWLAIAHTPRRQELLEALSAELADHGVAKLLLASLGDKQLGSDGAESPPSPPDSKYQAEADGVLAPFRRGAPKAWRRPKKLAESLLALRHFATPRAATQVFTTWKASGWTKLPDLMRGAPPEVVAASCGLVASFAAVDGSGPAETLATEAVPEVVLALRTFKDGGKDTVEVDDPRVNRMKLEARRTCLRAVGVFASSGPRASQGRRKDLVLRQEACTGLEERPAEQKVCESKPLRQCVAPCYATPAVVQILGTVQETESGTVEFLEDAAMACAALDSVLTSAQDLDLLVGWDALVATGRMDTKDLAGDRNLARRIAQVVLLALDLVEDAAQPGRRPGPFTRQWLPERLQCLELADRLQDGWRDLKFAFQEGLGNAAKTADHKGAAHRKTGAILADLVKEMPNQKPLVCKVLRALTDQAPPEDWAVRLPDLEAIRLAHSAYCTKSKGAHVLAQQYRRQRS